MRRSTPFPPMAGFVTVLAAAACGDFTTLESPDDDLVMDAAVLAADATIEEVRLWTRPFGFGGEGGGAQELQPGPGEPGGHHPLGSDFSGTRSVTFYDVEGQEQAGYDPLTTASIHLAHEVEGTVVRELFTAEVARSRDMTVSGLEGEESERTWTGTGRGTLVRSGALDDGSKRVHSAETAFVFEDVVVPIPGVEPGYPISGTIRRSLTLTRVTPDGTRSREVQVVITFDGSEIATAVVNGETMQIDLSTRDGRHPFRRHRR